MKRTEKENIPPGKETILLVDDEEEILDSFQQVLGMLGYTVLTAERGEKAIKCYKDRKNHIDLVILDLDMPGMGGYQCLKELRRIDSGIKIIIASGSSEKNRVKDMLESGADAFIAKPYQFTDMSKTIREVLKGRENR